MLNANLVRPFSILSVVEKPNGKGVTYRVTRRSVEGNSVRTMSLDGYLLVTDDEDVVLATEQHLRQGGWIDGAFSE